MPKFIFLSQYALAVLLCLPVVAHADANQAQTHNEVTGAALLYSAYCSACHDSQVHWRDARIATDWDSLVAQVRRWQGLTGLQWSQQDIDAVARYLNDSYYHYSVIKSAAK